MVLLDTVASFDGEVVLEYAIDHSPLAFVRALLELEVPVPEPLQRVRRADVRPARPQAYLCSR